MPPQKLFYLVFQNILRNKKNFVFSTVGIVVGVGMFTFFLSLGEGIREGVLNRIYPINQLEIEPRTVNLLGVKERLTDVPLNDERLAQLTDIDGVASAYPKQRSKFQARLWGGKSLFERDVHTEAFFDGIDPPLLFDEIRANELGTSADGSGRRRKRKLPCKRDGECGPAQECRDEVCEDIQYFRLFKDWGEDIPCVSDDGCARGAACLGGFCRDNVCDPVNSNCAEGSHCQTTFCDKDADCGGTESCTDGRCSRGYCVVLCDPTSGAGVASSIPPRSTCAPHEWCVGRRCEKDSDCSGAGVCHDGRCSDIWACERIPCELATFGDQYTDLSSVGRGSVPGWCADGSIPREGQVCDMPLQCPERTYCAPPVRPAYQGTCELPIPVVLSPFLVEMFNTTAATALGLRRVSETQALLGLGFRIQFGDSFFADDVAKERQVIKRAQIVGFSNKALDLGVTMPLRYVERANARFRGTQQSGLFDSVLLDTISNESVHRVTAAVEQMGFELSRKSRDAKKAGNMLYILTLVFALISWVILTIAAINISHTFLMVIFERKREIGVLRSIGATRMDIRKLVLAEAALIGVVGGVLGLILSVLASYGVNSVAQQALKDLPFRPDNFFVYSLSYMLASIGMAIVFCIMGAFMPANRAAKLDPAEVLSQA
ncbi:MAG: ABC transporter permease [Myxococcales bacterium]|nr:ABC transporter permease [Myxococcales bacterium]